MIRRIQLTDFTEIMKYLAVQQIMRFRQACHETFNSLVCSSVLYRLYFDNTRDIYIYI